MGSLSRHGNLLRWSDPRSNFSARPTTDVCLCSELQLSVLGGCACATYQISQNPPILLTGPDLPPVAVSLNFYICLNQKFLFSHLLFPAKNPLAKLFATFETEVLVKVRSVESGEIIDNCLS